MSRIRRNYKPLTTVSVTEDFREGVMKLKNRYETTAQRCDKILNMYNNNESVFWFTQYEKVKSELLAIKEQKPWWIKNE